jgi:4-amino-4-deoxy-L-arabinose transferase-like glycosyltransferase
MKRAWLLLILILVMQVVLRLPFLGEPLNQDEATYAQIANRIAQGEVLYRDLVDVKPPGVFYLFLLLGQNAARIRYFTLIFSLLLTLSVFRLGRQLLDDRLGLTAASLYAVFSGGVFIEGTQATPENFMLLPLLLALSVFIVGAEREKGGSWWLFLAGFLSRLAVLVKQPAAFNLVALGLLLLVIDRQRRRPAALAAGRVLALAGGAVLGPLLVVAYFWSQGALADFINANFFYSLGMARPALLNFIVKTVLLMLFENSVIWVLAAAGGYLIIRRYRTEKLATLLTWALFSVLGVYAAGFALGHYYIQVIPGLCLLAAFAILNWPALGLSRSAGRLFLILLAVLGLFIISSQYEFYLVYGPDRISAERYGNDGNSVARDIGLKLAARTAPGDRVYGISSTVFY